MGKKKHEWTNNSPTLEIETSWLNSQMRFVRGQIDLNAW
jgi:hypothetical protein